MALQEAAVRTLILLLLAVGMIGAALALHWHFGLSLEVTIALVGLVGVAASVVALLLPSEKRPQFAISDCYLTISYRHDPSFVQTRFETKLLNTSDRRDTLMAVEYLFYRADGARIPTGLTGMIFGARDLFAAQGQILPCPLEPGTTYLVEGSDHCAADSVPGRMLVANATRDAVMRCRFVFKAARPITVRVHPHGNKLVRGSLFTELKLLVARDLPQSPRRG